MRKPRGGQIRANRLIGPRKVLGEGDRRVPAKGRGRTAPYRGRSAASWIWSTPLDASASEGELRSGYALTPSPSHSRNNLSFLQKGGPRKGPSQRTATALFFQSLCGDFQSSLREFYLTLIKRVHRLCTDDAAPGCAADGLGSHGPEGCHPRDTVDPTSTCHHDAGAE